MPTINRATRRAAIGTVTAAAVALSVAALDGCASTVASISSAAVNGAVTAIIARGQAIVTTLSNAATQLGANLSASAQTAIAKVVSTVTSIGSLVANGATAVANATASSGITGLVTTAGNMLLGLLNLVPGLGTLTGIIQDAITVAPTLISFAQSIINPTAAGAAPYDGGAARRLGVIA